MTGDKELKLLLYDKITIVDGLTFVQPTIKDITDIGYYNFILSVYLFFNPKDLLIEAKDLYDMFKENEMDEYEVLSYLLDNDGVSKELINDFLKNHFKEDFKIHNGKMEFNGAIMDKKIYNEVCGAIRVCYDLDERLSDKNFANKIAMTMMVNLIRNRRKQAKRHGEHTESKASPLLPVISIVRTRITDSDVLKMSNYQLIDFYKTINREKQYEAALNGVYNGSVAPEKVSKIWTGED